MSMSPDQLRPAPESISLGSDSIQVQSSEATQPEILFEAWKRRLATYGGIIGSALDSAIRNHQIAPKLGELGVYMRNLRAREFHSQINTALESGDPSRIALAEGAMREYQAVVNPPTPTSTPAGE